MVSYADRRKSIINEVYAAATLEDRAQLAAEEANLLQEERLLEGIHRQLLTDYEPEIRQIYPEAYSGLPARPRSRRLIEHEFYGGTYPLSFFPSEEAAYPFYLQLSEKIQLLTDPDRAELELAVREVEDRLISVFPNFEQFIKASSINALELYDDNHFWHVALIYDIFATCFLATRCPDIVQLLETIGFKRLGSITPEILIELYEAVTSGREVIPIPYISSDYDHIGVKYQNDIADWEVNRGLKAHNSKYLLVPIVAENLQTLIERTRNILALLNYDSNRRIECGLVDAHGLSDLVSVGKFTDPWEPQIYKQIDLRARELRFLKLFLIRNGGLRFLPQNLTFMSCLVGKEEPGQLPIAQIASSLGMTTFGPISSIATTEIVVNLDPIQGLIMRPQYIERSDTPVLRREFHNGNIVGIGDIDSHNRVVELRRSLRIIETALLRSSDDENYTFNGSLRD